MPFISLRKLRYCLSSTRKRSCLLAPWTCWDIERKKSTQPCLCCHSTLQTRLVQISISREFLQRRHFIASNYGQTSTGRKIKSMPSINAFHDRIHGDIFIFLTVTINGQQFACSMQFTWRRTSNNSFSRWYSVECRRSTLWRLFNGRRKIKRTKMKRIVSKERKEKIEEKKKKRNWSPMNGERRAYLFIQRIRD